MPTPKFDKLAKLIGPRAERAAAKETAEQLPIEAEEDGLGAKILDILDRPGRATRAAIGAYQDDQPILDAAAAQLGSNPPEAPTGADIAEKTGLTNPYALTALATLADVADPTMFVPGGQIAKAAPVAKMAGKSKTLAQVAKRLGISEDAAKAFRKEALARKARSGETVAESLQKAPSSPFGKVVVAPTAEEKAMLRMKEAAGLRKLQDEAMRAPTPKKSNVSDIRNSEEFKRRLRENKD